MSNQPPLNPDALEAMSRQIDPDWWQIIDNYPGDIATPRYRKTALDKAERYARAYLAAALPEVTSVEELEALPAKTVILDSHGEVSVITETGRFMCDDGECYYLDEVADDLPARVLYRPSEQP